MILDKTLQSCDSSIFHSTSKFCRLFSGSTIKNLFYMCMPKIGECVASLRVFVVLKFFGISPAGNL